MNKLPVPQIYFKLQQLEQQLPPSNLHSLHSLPIKQKILLQRANNKRIIGKIRNVSKQLVSNVLEKFRPHQIQQHQIFEKKKQQATQSIHDIYQHKQLNERQMFIKWISKKNTDYNSIHNIIAGKHQTPNRRKQQSYIKQDSGNMRTFSASKSTDKKINYHRQQKKFSQEQQLALRIRSGLYKPQ